MALSNLYVVSILLQWTREQPATLAWRQSGDDGLHAECNGVCICLANVYSRTGTRRVVQLTSGDESTSILEPVQRSLFGRHYRDEEDRRLAEAMAQLFRAAARQHAERQCRLEARASEVREGLFRRLVFGETSSQGAGMIGACDSTSS